MVVVLVVVAGGLGLAPGNFSSEAEIVDLFLSIVAKAFPYTCMCGVAIIQLTPFIYLLPQSHPSPPARCECNEGCVLFETFRGFCLLSVGCGDTLGFGRDRYGDPVIVS